MPTAQLVRPSQMKALQWRLTAHLSTLRELRSLRTAL